METKICKRCNIEKNISEYNKDKYSSDGYRYRCRVCTSNEYKNFYYRNKEEEISRQIKYQSNNIENVKNKRRERYHKKYYNDILYKIKINFRNRVKGFIYTKNLNLKVGDTYSILGCTPIEFKQYIEKQFKPGMGWDNYRLDGWHIDHIIPLCNAKTIEDVYKLCHHTNLQPLWCYENYKKGKKIL
jgi:hypothetical protein